MDGKNRVNKYTKIFDRAGCFCLKSILGGISRRLPKGRHRPAYNDYFIHIPVVFLMRKI
jgi:hypothetical protein